MITIRNSSLDYNPQKSENCGNFPLSKSGSGLFYDADTALILALILLLYSDNCDRLLILALIYIMS